MNFTDTTTYSNTWRRIRGHHIALAAGVALAAAAAIGFADFERVSDGDVSRGLISQPSAAAGTTRAPRQVIYILDSESRRQEISMAAGELAQGYASNGLVPDFVTAVVAEPGDLQANLLLATMAGELMHYSPNTQVVDLR
jgi:hypothetical protein